MTTHTDVVIIGSGISGIAAAVNLKRNGIDDFVVIDKAQEVGGTWRQNEYPGVACDIPSALYSFSFAPNPNWSRFFAPGSEIQQYLLRVASEFDLRRHLRLGTEVLEAQWHDDQARWHIATSSEGYVARIVIFAAGALEDANVPPIPGLETFEGRIFHSSQWPKDYDVTGHHIAVIGTGASSIQIVPAIEPAAESVTVFQRTPSWIFPKPDWRHSRLERTALRRFPLLRRSIRLAVWTGVDVMMLMILHPFLARLSKVPALLFLRLQVRDRELRTALTPKYLPGCKRVLISNTFYRALKKPHVHLVNSPVVEITPRSVVDADGEKHPVDAIVLSTGFNYTAAPIFARIKTRDGRTLDQKWQGSPRAYKGTALAGCPNAFMLWGPNAGTGSAFVMAEAQMAYVIGAIKTIQSRDLEAIEVRQDREDAWKEWADKRNAGSVMIRGGCVSYYLDSRGNNAALWPGTMHSLRKSLSHFDIAAYHLRPISRDGAEPLSYVDGMTAHELPSVGLQGWTGLATRTRSARLAAVSIADAER